MLALGVYDRHSRGGIRDLLPARGPFRHLWHVPGWNHLRLNGPVIRNEGTIWERCLCQAAGFSHIQPPGGVGEHCCVPRLARNNKQQVQPILAVEYAVGDPVANGFDCFLCITIPGLNNSHLISQSIAGRRHAALSPERER